MCKNRVMKLIGAPLQEQANIVCEVDAFPPPDTFEWVLNSSLGSIKVDSVSNVCKFCKIEFCPGVKSTNT